MLMNTYNRFPVTFTGGSGCYLYDESGKKYLDFASGIGVCSLGCAHPKWTAAVTEQAAKLAHTSNLFHTLPAAKLAERLSEISGLQTVFFANSGAEANEGMIKMARKYSKDKYGPGRHTIVTLKRSFHGRTITTLSATGQENFHKHFDPFTPGFIHVPANDGNALRQLGDGICAVLLEPVQGEGGVFPLSEAYVREAAELCHERDWLLLFDEVQTGIGRTGLWFGFQNFSGVKPDGLSFAKGIAGGLPLGGFIAGEKCGAVLKPGDHATTFGGNPVCCAAALAVLEVVSGILPEIKLKGEKLLGGLSEIPGLSEARGMGLMIGATVNGSHRALAEALLKEGLVCLTAGSDSLRLMPPLVVSDAELEEGLSIIGRICL